MTRYLRFNASASLSTVSRVIREFSMFVFPKTKLRLCSSFCSGETSTFLAALSNSCSSLVTGQPPYGNRNLIKPVVKGGLPGRLGLYQSTAPSHNKTFDGRHLSIQRGSNVSPASSMLLRFGETDYNDWERALPSWGGYPDAVACRKHFLGWGRTN
jgi:hypothetical protein